MQALNKNKKLFISISLERNNNARGQEGGKLIQKIV